MIVASTRSTLQAIRCVRRLGIHRWLMAKQTSAGGKRFRHGTADTPCRARQNHTTATEFDLRRQLSSFTGLATKSG
jgi:hypothetical protein